MAPRQFGRYAVNRRFKGIGGDGGGQHFANTGPHRANQKLGGKRSAQQNDGNFWMVRRDVFDLHQFMRVAAHAVNNHQVRLFLLRNDAHFAFAAVNQNRRMGVGFEHAPHVLQMGFVGGYNSDFHGCLWLMSKSRRCWGLAA